MKSNIGDGTFLTGTLVPPRRNENGHWLPGQSGNLEGRTPLLKGVMDLARQHTETAIAVLAEIVNDSEQPSARRIVACNSLLDRG
jgi:hypothetical protein